METPMICALCLPIWLTASTPRIVMNMNGELKDIGPRLPADDEIVFAMAAFGSREAPLRHAFWAVTILNGTAVCVEHCIR